MTLPASDRPTQSFEALQHKRANWHPDPMRAHGAWIYLFASIAAGALLGADRGVEPAMLVGTAYAGGYLVFAAADVGLRGKLRQIMVGACLAIACGVLALISKAEPAFLIAAALAALPALAAVALAKAKGVLSPATLVVGIAALTMSAPVTAVAGGMSLPRAAVLFVLLWTFFSWRTLNVAASLTKDSDWEREVLRARGLREAAIAALWTLVVATTTRIV